MCGAYPAVRTQRMQENVVYDKKNSSIENSLIESRLLIICGEQLLTPWSLICQLSWKGKCRSKNFSELSSGHVQLMSKSAKIFICTLARHEICPWRYFLLFLEKVYMYLFLEHHGPTSPRSKTLGRVRFVPLRSTNAHVWHAQQHYKAFTRLVTIRLLSCNAISNGYKVTPVMVTSYRSL